jgi:hypothetical protein
VEGNAVGGCGSGGGEDGGFTQWRMEFELTVRKRKAYAVAVEGVEGCFRAEVEAGKAGHESLRNH